MPARDTGHGPATLCRRIAEAWDACRNFCNSYLSGITVGAVYALVALGFTIIYNASDVVNFAQGEFVMLGGMITVFAHAAGLPLPLAALIAIVATARVGVAHQQAGHRTRTRRTRRVADHHHHRRCRSSCAGAAQLIFDKQIHSLPGLFRRRRRSASAEATILPQSLWVIAGRHCVFFGSVAVLHRAR
jgi:branched-chain amino acid transport system permease protein